MPRRIGNRPWRGSIVSLLVIVLAASAAPLLDAGASIAPAPFGQATPLASPAAGTHDRPNIVLIVADDLDLASVAAMPRLRSLLADQGATFTNAFVTTSLCCPSRVSILRGQYAHNHGVLTNTGDHGGFPTYDRLDGEEDSLPTWLDDAGYATAYFGKYLNGYPKGVDPRYVPPGWDEWRAVASRVPSYVDYTLNENGRLVAYGDAPDDYLTDVLGRQLTDVVGRSAADAEPFFAYLAPYAPHWPATPAPRHADALGDVTAPRPPSFDEADVADKPAWVRQAPPLSADQVADLDRRHRDRLRTLLALDETIGDLVATLEASGILDQTYLIFTSDNGFHLGEHRLAEGKQTAYDEATRVPLIVRGPGILPGSRIDELALNIDLAPTIAEFAGTTAPAFVDGRSLVPLLGIDADRPRPTHWRQRFLVERFDPVKTRNRRGARAEDAAGKDADNEIDVPPYAAMRTADRLYVAYETGEREWYDLATDPHQLDNRAATAAPATIADADAHLSALRSCAASGCRTAEDAPSEATATDGRRLGLRIGTGKRDNA